MDAGVVEWRGHAHVVEEGSSTLLLDAWVVSRGEWPGRDLLLLLVGQGDTADLGRGCAVTIRRGPTGSPRGARSDQGVPVRGGRLQAALAARGVRGVAPLGVGVWLPRGRRGRVQGWRTFCAMSRNLASSSRVRTRSLWPRRSAITEDPAAGRRLGGPSRDGARRRNSLWLSLVVDSATSSAVSRRSWLRLAAAMPYHERGTFANFDQQSPLEPAVPVGVRPLALAQDATSPSVPTDGGSSAETGEPRPAYGFDVAEDGPMVSCEPH